MNAIREAEVRHHARVFMMDMVTLALGRMGKREAFFKEFDKVLAEVSEEYSAEILEDAKADQELWYSKDVLDRELAQYVGSRFVPYDERYKWEVRDA
jgi:hypothetical protein